MTDYIAINRLFQLTDKKLANLKFCQTTTENVLQQ